ncbi:MAG: site-2 protease family protein [bacterium]|nr:site-2 protease family protein [bacterium]
MNIQSILVSLPVFLLAIILHEVAHGWVAYRLGDPTAKWAGRLTLNPVSHIDPLGAIFFLISLAAGIGFGWAKPVPVNVYNMKDPRRGMVLVSLAGPAANAAQALIYALILRVMGAGVFFPSVDLGLLGYVCYAGVIVNIMLAIFNLLPVPPLDGSKILMGLLPHRQAYRLSRIEPYGMLILLFLIFTHGIDFLARHIVFPAATLLIGA